MIVLQAAYIRPEYFSDEFSAYPAWPRFDAERSLALFAFTMAILIAPKFMGLGLALIETRTRKKSGGAFLLVVSSLFEILMSALLAPIMMLIQSGSVIQILLGRDTGWNPQRRDDGSIPFSDIVRRHRSHTALGVIMLMAGLIISPSLVAWMSPTIAGLILAIPLSWATAQLGLGLALKRVGILQTPEEVAPPPIAVAANQKAQELAALGEDDADGLALMHSDAEFRALHDAYLPIGHHRKRGEISVDRAMAEAKLADAHSFEEAQRWLTAKERMVVLHDRALIDVLARLKDESSQNEPA
jgi:membrane glycosyltransferase